MDNKVISKFLAKIYDIKEDVVQEEETEVSEDAGFEARQKAAQAAQRKSVVMRSQAVKASITKK